jgi:hypothetical protein
MTCEELSGAVTSKVSKNLIDQINIDADIFKLNIGHILKRCVPAISALLLMLVILQPSRASDTVPQYLLFHIFNGAMDPPNGVYSSTAPKSGILAIARNIAATVRPTSSDPNRILGFDIGPIAMDQGVSSAQSTILDAFDIAVATNMAVAIHLDDYMFWKAATLANGAALLAQPGVTEWTDWNGNPAPPPSISWVPSNKLAPQMCYECPAVQAYTQYWVLSIGYAIAEGYQHLLAAGKGHLFAGVFAGWESNLQFGYHSLTYLGYSASNPPANLANAQAVVLQRHVSLWAQYLNQAGIPAGLIFTHLAIPSGIQPWVAFNPYSTPGWSNYVWQDNFQEIYNAVGSNPWVQAEGSNVVLAPSGASPSPYHWETYLAANYNHGARIVTIFGAFQGATDGFQSAVSTDALAAYKKFLGGALLIE